MTQLNAQAKLDETISPIPQLPDDVFVSHDPGHLFPRRAFDQAVLQRLRQKDSCLAFLLEIIRT